MLRSEKGLEAGWYIAAGPVARIRTLISLASFTRDILSFVFIDANIAPT